RGGHVPRPGAGAPVGGPLGEDVDHGHEDQQTGGGELHPAHPAPLLLVRGAERGHRAVRDGAGAGMLPLGATLSGFWAFGPFHPLAPVGDPSHIVPSWPTPGTEQECPAPLPRGDRAGWRGPPPARDASWVRRTGASGLPPPEENRTA